MVCCAAACEASGPDVPASTTDLGPEASTTKGTLLHGMHGDLTTSMSFGPSSRGWWSITRVLTQCAHLVPSAAVRCELSREQLHQVVAVLAQACRL